MTVRGIEAFLAEHAARIETITRFSRDHLTADDVRQEACLQAMELAVGSGFPIDLSDEAQAEQVLRRVRRVIDRAGRLARKTRSLDQPFGEDGTASLLDVLADADGAHPLSLLEAMESPAIAPESPDLPDPYHSQLAAWAWLLRRFGFRTRKLAEFLMISESWCYQRRRRIRERFDAAQPSLPQRVGTIDGEDGLRPWRRFKLPGRTRQDDARQALFDFWGKPEQPVAGQLWLL